VRRWTSWSHAKTRAVCVRSGGCRPRAPRRCWCRNLLTTADDDFLDAAGDVNEAAFVGVADVAVRNRPAILGERLAG